MWGSRIWAAWIQREIGATGSFNEGLPPDEDEVMFVGGNWPNTNSEVVERLCGRCGRSIAFLPKNIELIGRRRGSSPLRCRECMAKAIEEQKSGS